MTGESRYPWFVGLAFEGGVRCASNGDSSSMIAATGAVGIGVTVDMWILYGLVGGGLSTF